MSYKINNFLKSRNRKLIFLISFFITLFFSINLSFASEIGCGDTNGEKRYKCQIKNNCDDYKPENFHFETKNYFFPKGIGDEGRNANNIQNSNNNGNLIDNAKKLYRENQNSIYACAIIDLQRNTLKIVKEQLSQIDKTGNLKQVIDKKIELKLSKIEIIEKQKKCISPSNQEKKDNTFNPKQQILNESAYEFCKYNYYLDFLKNYYKETDNINKTILQKTKANSTKVSEMAKIYNNIQNQILEEEEHSAKVFSMAFETYVDYENNYPVHVLLEVIKEDFKILRRKFHQVINPLNQVVYKISNAMSIH